VTEGLTAPRSGFTLNNLPITIYSGSIHYFRVHPDYWRDRLRKARAAGLNAVDTYVIYTKFSIFNMHLPEAI
jgi:beta-galactosidase GanA